MGPPTMNNPANTSVVIIDDTRTNSLILERILGKEGLEVFYTGNGPDGRALVKEAKPSLVLLDILMPGEDGFQVLEKLKADATTNQIPVILITSVEEATSKVRGFELGAVDYITKPFDPTEVIMRVRLHIKMYQTIQSLATAQAETLKQIQSAQQSLLVRPKGFPGAHFDVLYHPLHAAGGDFYEVFEISQNTYGYFVADFAGHDISTSFLTSSIKGLLKQNCNPWFEPQESMRIMNTVLIDLMQPGQYLTACYCILDQQSGETTIINMGHPPILLLKQSEPGISLPLEGDVLGAFPDAVFEKGVYQLHPGDSLLMYTDGILETEKNKIWTAELPAFTRTVDALYKSNGGRHLLHEILSSNIGSGKRAVDDVLMIFATFRPDENISQYELNDALFLTLKSKMGLLDEVVEHAIRFIESHQITTDPYGFKLVLFECIGNAIRHGNKDAPDKFVDLQISFDSADLIISVTDEGLGFDWHLIDFDRKVPADHTDGRGCSLLKAYGYKAYFNRRGSRITLRKSLV